MSQYNALKWVGVKPTVATAKTPAKTVAIGAASTEVLAAAEDRTSYCIRNTGTLDVYYRNGATATLNDMLLEPGDVAYDDDYTGQVTAIRGGVAGELRVIEN